MIIDCNDNPQEEEGYDKFTDLTIIISLFYCFAIGAVNSATSYVVWCKRRPD